MEEEVITPQRGGGGVRPLSLRVHHVGYEQYLIIFLDFPEDSLWEGDLDRQDIGSPVDMLVNTVALMQNSPWAICKK